MNTLRLIDRLLYKIEVVLLVALLGTMLGLAVWQVILRNVFSTGLVWADTVVRHLVMWLGFVGGALATADERHINIDALTKLIPQRGRRMVAVATNAFATIVCYFMARSAWTFMLDERASGGELVLSVPTWVALTILPSGYGVIAFHFFVKMVENLSVAFGKPVSEKPA